MKRFIRTAAVVLVAVAIFAPAAFADHDTDSAERTAILEDCTPAWDVAEPRIVTWDGRTLHGEPINVKALFWGTWQLSTLSAPGQPTQAELNDGQHLRRWRWEYECTHPAPPVVIQGAVQPITDDSPRPVVRAVPAPTPMPVATPVATPAVTPSVTPSATPIATPSVTPSATPAATPVATPVATPEPEPERWNAVYHCGDDGMNSRPFSHTFTRAADKPQDPDSIVLGPGCRAQGAAFMANSLWEPTGGYLVPGHCYKVWGDERIDFTGDDDRCK